MKKSSKMKKIFLILLFIYLFVPVIATILFSVSKKWDVTILPESYTLDYYKAIFSDPRFFVCLTHTCIISAAASLFSAVIIVPCIYLSVVHYKFLEKLFDLFSIIPFVIPGVILAIGLIEMFSGSMFDITGTVWILLGAYFVLCLPFMYQTIRNSFRTINAPKLVEAALILGSTEMKAFLTIIVPNVIKGIISAILLSISIIFGEFVLANLLVGSSYENIQIYLYNALNTDGHKASAVVSVYLVIILLLSFITIKLSSKNKSESKE